MSTETNKALVQRYRAIYNANQLENLGDVLAADYLPHTLFPGMSPSLDTYKQIHQMALSVFPDMQVKTEDLLAEGDYVVERWSQTQTHTGAPFFVGNIPASGKRADTTGISIYRVQNGKIVEHWADMDFLAVLQQVGAVPTPGL